jgi:hypothetical protein
VSLTTMILINGILDLGIVLAVAATMLFPFTLDRRKEEATVYEFAAPIPEDLAAYRGEPGSAGVERQRDHEGRAAVRRRPRFGAPAVRLDHGRDDGKAEAGTAARAGP